MSSTPDPYVAATIICHTLRIYLSQLIHTSRTPYPYVTNSSSLCHQLLIHMSLPHSYVTNSVIFGFICHKFLIPMSATPDPYMSLPHLYVSATIICHKLRIYLSQLISTSRTPDSYVSNALPICHSHRHKSRTLYLYVTYKRIRQQLLIHTSLPHSYVTNSFFMCQHHMHKSRTLYLYIAYKCTSKQLIYMSRTPDPSVSNALLICHTHMHKSRTLYLYVAYKCTSKQLLIHTLPPQSYSTIFFSCVHDSSICHALPTMYVRVERNGATLCKEEPPP